MFDSPHNKRGGNKRKGPRKNRTIQVIMHKPEADKLKEIAEFNKTSMSVFMRQLFLRELGRLGISVKTDFLD